MSSRLQSWLIAGHVRPKFPYPVLYLQTHSDSDFNCFLMYEDGVLPCPSCVRLVLQVKGLQREGTKDVFEILAISMEDR